MSNLDLVIVGSVGIDDVATPTEERTGLLGGSASYACAAASFWSKTGMVGVVGTDFPQAHTDLYKKFNIDLEGLQVKEGKTFYWSGKYHENMDNRDTLVTELNVFEHFTPDLPESYRGTKNLFLGNIAPELQLKVLEQVEAPRFTLVDTMDLWINIAHEELTEVIRKVTMLTLNESEARLYTGRHSVHDAAKELLDLGPEYVLVKRGENGSFLFSKAGSVFIMPAYLVNSVVDPTGAGDTFAGGLMGYLSVQEEINDEAIRHAILHGNIVASFGVEDFSLERYESLAKGEIETRISQFRDMLL